MKRTFYGIVTEQDLPKDRTPSTYFNDPPRGPIMMETYLDYHTDRAEVEKRLPAFTKYGWVAIAEITVEIPDAPAAIPEAAAGVHA